MMAGINMVSFRDVYSGMKLIGISASTPVIVHTSLSAFGEVQGGAETLLGALMAAFPALMMPAFTYKTMIIPETGPKNNGITYGTGKDLNRMAEFYSPQLPADRLMGVVAELLRLRPNAARSSHPIFSFTGVNVEDLLLLQTLQDPFGLLGELALQNGWVVLAGVDHTVNTSIHFVEKIAHRQQFIRWALTQSGAVQCNGFPGCSDGFDQAATPLNPIIRQVAIGDAIVRALPLQPMIEILVGVMSSDPLALLCKRQDCERCRTVRYGLQIIPN
jgi:aminoglycoside 3-N-acetyltransferase